MDFNTLHGRNRRGEGLIEIIFGCMFSGKTEELIKQIRRTQIAKQPWQAFKPHIDSRYSESDVASHDQKKIPATPVHEAGEILNLVGSSAEVIAIDEGQFFDEEIVNVVTTLANSGRRVIVSGLDTDWRGRPFGPMPHLMCLADVIRKQYAICRTCGAPATRTQRLVAAQDDILVGSTEAYEARCRQHFDPDLSLRMAGGEPNPKIAATPGDDRLLLPRDM